MKKVLFVLLVGILPFVFNSCSEDENTIYIDNDNIELNFEEEYHLNATSKLPITYWSKDKFHATVSNTGLIIGGRVGNTKISLTNGESNKTVDVTIMPKYNLYDDPFLRFGATKEMVKSKLGNPATSDDNIFGYESIDKNGSIVMYMFDNNGKLETVMVTLFDEYSGVTARQISGYLEERYIPVTSTNEAILFINAIKIEESTMGVILMRNVLSGYKSHYLIRYSPYEANNKSSANYSPSVFDFSIIDKCMDKLIK